MVLEVSRVAPCSKAAYACGAHVTFSTVPSACASDFVLSVRAGRRVRSSSMTRVQLVMDYRATTLRMPLRFVTAAGHSVGLFGLDTEFLRRLAKRMT